MKVYKVELLVVDFDGVGDGIADVFENARYPNRCISPLVMGIKSADIGEWDDSHPLNNRKTSKQEFERLFGVAA